MRSSNAVIGYLQVHIRIYKKYAEWIAQELKAEIHDAKNFDVALFSNYDLVIFGGSLHAVGINGIKIVKQNLPILKNKKIIVFCVGASPPRENILKEVKNNNFNAEQQQNIAFY